MNPARLDPLLTGLRWTRVRGALRNTRDAAAQVHPWWILHGTLKHGVPDDAQGREWPFTFRLLAEAAPRIERGQIYPFEIFSPVDDPGLGREFIQRLGEHLAHPTHNFEIVELEDPVVRTLADLERATAPWPDDLSEICLDFQTPFAFTPKDDRRRWRLAADQLGYMLGNRLKNFFRLPAAPETAAWDPLITLCHFWKYVEHGHKSSSGTGAETFAGNVGPLYLRGNPAELATIRPWLLLGAELGGGLKPARQPVEPASGQSRPRSVR